jgi:Bacterial Ig domain
MLKKILFPVAVILLFLQCDLPTRSDVIPPGVTIVYPTEGTVVSANTQIKIEAYDDKLSKVWAYVDGNLIGETKTKPFLIDLEIAAYQDGLNHTVQAFASDKTGNLGSSGVVNFIVAETDDVIDPTVTILNPQSGQTVEDTVRVVAVALDERAIQKVAFFIDGDSVGLDDTYPYHYNWDTKPYADSTNHTIYAKAFDTGNNTGTSAVVSVTVYPSTDLTPPGAIMTYPLTGQIVFDTVTVTVEASDNKGVAMIEFFVDGQLQFTDTQAPYQFEWNTIPYADGATHSLYAKAYDLTGNATTTAINTITVSSTSSDDITPPSATLLYPLTGSNVNGTVNIVADVIDDRAMGYVEFYIDGELLFTDTQSSDGTWSFAWDASSYADGLSHSIYLKAYDAAGNSSATPITTVFVTQNEDITSPTVVTLFPINLSTVSGTITIRADAEDDFAVNNVQFYIDGVLLSTDSNGADGWSAVWNTAAQADSRSHSVYLKANDNAGNFGTSFITVTVTP